MSQNHQGSPAIKGLTPRIRRGIVANLSPNSSSTCWAQNNQSSQVRQPQSSGQTGASERPTYSGYRRRKAAPGRASYVIRRKLSKEIRVLSLESGQGFLMEEPRGRLRGSREPVARRCSHSWGYRASYFASESESQFLHVKHGEVAAASKLWGLRETPHGEPRTLASAANWPERRFHCDEAGFKHLPT